MHGLWSLYLCRLYQPEELIRKNIRNRI